MDFGFSVFLFYNHIAKRVSGVICVILKNPPDIKKTGWLFNVRAKGIQGAQMAIFISLF